MLHPTDETYTPIIEGLPFIPEVDQFMIGDDIVTIKKGIVLWASVTELLRVIPPTIESHPPIPMILDTGFDARLLIQSSHYEKSVEPYVNQELMPVAPLPTHRLSDFEIRAGAIWIYPNFPYSSEVMPNASPFRVPLARGFYVSFPQGRFVRKVPLLGLSALQSGNCHVHLDGPNERVNIYGRDISRPRI